MCRHVVRDVWVYVACVGAAALMDVRCVDTGYMFGVWGVHPWYACVRVMCVPTYDVGWMVVCAVCGHVHGVVVGVYIRCVYVRGFRAIRVYVDMRMMRKRTRGERCMYTSPMCVAYAGTGDVRTVYVLGMCVCRWVLLWVRDKGVHTGPQ